MSPTVVTESPWIGPTGEPAAAHAVQAGQEDLLAARVVAKGELGLHAGNGLGLLDLVGALVPKAVQVLLDVDGRFARRLGRARAHGAGWELRLALPAALEVLGERRQLRSGRGRGRRRGRRGGRSSGGRSRRSLRRRRIGGHRGGRRLGSRRGGRGSGSRLGSRRSGRGSRFGGGRGGRGATAAAGAAAGAGAGLSAPSTEAADNITTDRETSLMVFMGPPRAHDRPICRLLRQAI